MNRKTPLPNEETTKSKFVLSTTKVSGYLTWLQEIGGNLEKLISYVKICTFLTGRYVEKKLFDRTVQWFCPLPWPQDYEQDVFFVTSIFSVQCSIEQLLNTETSVRCINHPMKDRIGLIINTILSTAIGNKNKFIFRWRRRHNYWLIIFRFWPQRDWYTSVRSYFRLFWISFPPFFYCLCGSRWNT